MLLCTLARLEGVREGGRGDARQLQYAHSWVGSGLHRTSLCFTAHTANTCTQYTVQCTHWVQYCMPVCVCVLVCVQHLPLTPPSPNFDQQHANLLGVWLLMAHLLQLLANFAGPPFSFFFFASLFICIFPLFMCACEWVCVTCLFACRLLSFAWLGSKRQSTRRGGGEGFFYLHTLANGFFGLHFAVAHGVCLIFEQTASQIMFYVFLHVFTGFAFFPSTRFAPHLACIGIGVLPSPAT